MCFVSFVGVSGYDKWYPNPAYQPPPNVIMQPSTITFTKPEPTAEELTKFYELVRKARLYDKITGKKDCVKPDVDAWLVEIEERLERVEDAVDDRLTPEQLVEALRVGLEDLGFSLEGFEEEL
jgi:hypothetical protein